MTSFSRSFAHACPTVTRSVMKVCVFLIVLVACGAMGFQFTMASGADPNEDSASLSPFCVSFTNADTATPRSCSSDPRVNGIVWMALRAVGPSLEIFPGITPANIYKPGYWLKMAWIDAASRSAEMVELQPFWDRSAFYLIEQAMYRNGAPSKHHAGISLPEIAHPNQAAAHRDWHGIEIDSFLKAGEGKLVIGHVTPFKSHCYGPDSRYQRGTGLSYFTPSGANCG